MFVTAVGDVEPLSATQGELGTMRGYACGRASPRVSTGLQVSRGREVGGSDVYPGGGRKLAELWQASELD